MRFSVTESKVHMAELADFIMRTFDIGEQVRILCVRQLMVVR